jgi:hypothetical protein
MHKSLLNLLLHNHWQITSVSHDDTVIAIKLISMKLSFPSYLLLDELCSNLCITQVGYYCWILHIGVFTKWQHLLRITSVEREVDQHKSIQSNWTIKFDTCYWSCAHIFPYQYSTISEGTSSMKFQINKLSH